MNLITIIIIILILILFTGILLLCCNRKDLEYNYTKFIGGDAEELNKDIQENDSKQIVNSDIYDEFKFNHEDFDECVVNINGKVISLDYNVFNNIVNSGQLIKNKAISVSNDFKQLLKTYISKVKSIFQHSITKIINYITKLCANPAEALTRWLASPSNIIKMGSLQVQNGVKLVKSFFNPKSIGKVLVENASKNVLVVLYTFYKSVVYNPITLELKNMFNKIFDIFTDQSYLEKISSFKDTVCNIFNDYVVGYIKSFRNIVNSLFDLISPKKLNDLLNKLLDIGINDKDKSSKLKAIFVDYINVVKDNVKEIPLLFNDTINNIYKLMEEDEVFTYSIDENVFDKLINNN